MTPKPHLLLRRLVISGSGRTVYDQLYHAGVNIIRGKNNSGKSTISEMIFYVLGGENVDWIDEAKACDWVHGEFDVSGLVLSLRREITVNDPPSIAVCEGPLSETMHTVNGWSSYGRTRSGNKESFSQFMFDRIGLPQTKSVDSQANVTMYQILRLLYADQNTDSTSIFRKERQPFADRQDIRRSVGEMLLGIDDLQGHELRQQQLHLVKQLAQKKSRFDSLLDAAEKTDPNFRISNYADQVKKADAEQKALDVAIGVASAQIETSKKHDKEAMARIGTLEKSLANINTKIETLRDTINSLSLGIADSEVFVSSLRSNLQDLVAANKAREFIGTVALAYCPICLADLAAANDKCCPLCKSSNSGEAISGGRLRYMQELKHQINESANLLDHKRRMLSGHETSIKTTIRERNGILTELRSMVNGSSQIDANISQLLKNYGYLTRKIEDLGRMESLQKEVESLENEVRSIRENLERVESAINRRQSQQESRRNHCQDRIGELTVDVLHKDIIVNANDTLRDASGLIFSFEKDFLSVRHGRLSASTQAFLKSSYYLGLLRFGFEDKLCRLPMFFVLDNIEDKGMTPERFRNFHHLLIQHSTAATVPHQVILTTSYIDDELDGSPYCVGPSYDHPPYTLDINGEWGIVREDSPETLPQDDGKSTQEAPQSVNKRALETPLQNGKGTSETPPQGNL